MFGLASKSCGIQEARSDAMTPTGQSKRKIVLHPRTALARRQDRARAFGSHVRGYTVDNDEVMELLVRQRRLSVRLLCTLILPLLSFPIVFRQVPALSTWRLFGLIPFPWLLLGPVSLFLIAAVAFVHERRALSIENEWKRQKSDQ